MKEKFTLAAIVIILTFLVGYLTVQTTTILRELVFGNVGKCETFDKSEKCSERDKTKVTLVAE